MLKKNFIKKTIIKLSALVFIIFAAQIDAQIQGSQSHEIKWLSVSSLEHWFSNGGAEIEYGRRGRAGFQNVDQLDGLLYPAQYNSQDVSVGKSLWIGTTNFNDPVSQVTYPYKVVSAGRLNMFLGTEIIADELKLIGNRDHPSVFVDNARASDLDFDDEVDEIDEDLPADRMIYNTVHTSIGVSFTRKVYAFTQQNHDNYYIYEYVFKNTGIIDESGEKKIDRTLTDVVFHYQFRYGFAGESYDGNWAPTGATWGLNCVNNSIGMDPNHPGDFRAVWSYYGPVSTAPSYEEDIGLPDHTNGNILAGSNYAGVVVLHADKSATDDSDDPAQPSTSQFMPSDRGAQGVDQYDPNLMTRKYVEFMTAGHPEQTHAEQVGTSFANLWGGDAGGYAAALGFGPYDLAPGDSIRIVVAEAVAGIMKDRENVREIARKWFNDEGPFTRPDGSTANDRNDYKNSWVLSGQDSLFETFRRALNNFNSGYNIPQPPPPPDEFNVNSGGNRINLSWSSSAETWPNFDGYEIYRAEGRADTTYDKIFSCDRASVVNSFEDRTATRGFNYFYYIVTKDDGSTNDINSGVPLVSSKFYTMTSREAFLTREPGTNLDGIRIVPNPYNIRSRELQFGLASPDRLAFYGLPPECIIRIFTETGQLVETIVHNDGSGDELWHSLTSSRQLVVSGLYIAHFEVTKDYTDESTGEILFRKGDTTIKKFIVIR